MNSKGSRIRKSKGSRVQGFKDSSEFNTLDPWTPWPLESCLRGQEGFTAIEAIMIVVILSILAFSIGLKMDITGSKSAVAADQLIADIRYVQMRAMGAGISQSMTFSTGSGTYTAGGEQKSLPGDENVSSTNFGNTLIFNSLGEPTYGAGNGTIGLSGGRTITIYGITGKTE
jgi:type II secretory pathway pseudopilin PulG